MKCPRCQLENSGDSTYCGRCGSRLAGSFEEPQTVATRAYVPLQLELEVGTMFAGRYQVLEELGRGGMGKVYKVVDREVNEKIAIKILKPEISLDEKIIERFRNELKLARKISHPNVCRMYDLSKEKGMYFITMEYISGEDLKSTVLRVGQLSVGKTLAIARQICKGLAEAHKMGIVHRDLKPHNIIIDREGDVHILDFGIARSMKTQGITGSGVTIGTPEYMSPEQAVGEEADERSDIYSLGVIMFELLTGIVPFKANTAAGVALKQRIETPPSPKSFNQQIPDDVNRMVLRCLEKGRDKRYQKVVDVLDEISRALKGYPTTDKILPGKPMTTPGVKGGSRTRPRVIALAAVLAVIACVAGYLVFRKPMPPLPAGYGLLIIDSRPPGASVYLNNDAKGITPLKAAFPADSYKLKIALNDYREIAEDVQVNEGKTLARKYPLDRLIAQPPEFGGIDISSSPPGASVYLNGEPKGNTPTGKINVRPGPYRLKITLADHKDVFDDIQVDKDMTSSKQYALERMGTTLAVAYSVLVTSEPSEANIFFNNKYQTKTPATITLPEGSGVLEIKKTNYITERESIALKPGTNPEIHKILKPSSVRISVQTVPPDARVTLDDIELGNSPTIERFVPTKQYTLNIQKPGYEPYNKQISLSKDSSPTITLSPLETVPVHPSSVRISVQTVPPDAKVTLDDIELGNSPTIERFVPPKQYTLNIQKPGYEPYTKQISLSEDSSPTITLSPLETVRVHFIATVVAELILNGVPFEKKLAPGWTETIPRGEYKVEFHSLNPEKRFSRTVVFERGRSYRVHGNILTEQINFIDTTDEKKK